MPPGSTVPVQVPLLGKREREAVAPGYKHLIAGMEWADSLAFDLHAWVSLQYPFGCVLVRNADHHHRVFSLTPTYLAHGEGERGLSGVDDAELDLNKRIEVELQERGIAVPSTVTIRGRKYLHVTITNPRSWRDDFDLLVREEIRTEDELACQGPATQPGR